MSHHGTFVSREGGRFWHFWRNNDAPVSPRNGPGLAMDSEDGVTNDVPIGGQSSPGELSSVRREGSHPRLSLRGYLNIHGMLRPRESAVMASIMEYVEQRLKLRANRQK